MPLGQQRLRECKRRADIIERRLLALLDPALEPALRQWLSDVATASLIAPSASP
jgi:hypothetical protein